VRVCRVKTAARRVKIMDDAAFFVLIADEGDPDHAKTRLLGSVEEAVSHVQTQVEAGVEQSRIRVFASTEMAVQVTFRPVVTISHEVAEDSDSDGQKDGTVRFSSMFKRA
jgi:hypothetical protein